jgi:hypothetical protein
VGGYFTQTVSLDSNTYYVVSADVKRNNDLNITSPVHIGLVGCRDAFNAQVSLYSPDNSMIADNSGAYQEVAADRFNQSTFQRISGRVYSGNAVTCQVFAGTTGTGPGHWFDNLQVHPTTNSSVLRQSVDSTSCNGQVGDKLGCHLFNDTSNTGLTYDVDLSPLGAQPTDADATGGAASCADRPELCDSNVVLKVSRDRTCSQWLSPTTTIESTKTTGEKENLVLGVATCDRFSPSGQCNRFVDEMRCSNNPKQTCVDNTDCGSGVCKPFPLTGNTQAYSREELRNRSGLVVAGLQFSSDQTIKGKYPFGVAPQVGDDGLIVKDDVLNGNLNLSSTLATSGWTIASDGVPNATDAGTSSDGSTAKLITFDTQRIAAGVATVAVDPYISVNPSGAGSGATTIRTTSAKLSNKLSSGRTYMLSFNVRYLQEPIQGIADTRLSAGISSADNISSTSAWYGKVQPTTTWQRFVVGPLKLSATAAEAEGNTAPGTHVSYQTNTGFVFIAADGTNRTPFAIDSVSVLPTLQVDDPIPVPPSPFIIGQQSGQSFTARSCRAYPSSSAKSCSYQDDTGKQFNGWQGYCLETDPKNPNTCLSWYPLDLLAGEHNAFGRQIASGYQDRSPLYMCAQSSGNYTSTTFSHDFAYESDFEGLEYGYRRPIWTSLDGGVENGPNCDGSDNIEDAGCGRSNPPRGMCGCAENDSLNRTVTLDARDQYYKYEMDKIDWVIVRGTTTDVNNWPIGATFTLNESNNWSNCWINGNSNRICATANFNADGLMTSMYGLIRDGSAEEGGAIVMGVVYLKEWCTQVVQVVGTGGTNAAWSGQMSTSSNLLSNYRYGLSQDTRPYGAIAQPELNFDNPALWDGGGLPGQEPVYVQLGVSSARAASTYGCVGAIGGQPGRNCSQRYCSTDYTNRCATAADITRCSAAAPSGNAGYCIGSAPVKVCTIADRAADVGKSCATNQECGLTTGVCDFANATGGYINRVGANYATGNPVATETQTSIDDRTRQRMQLLFANAYDAWQWDRTAGEYVNYLTAGQMQLPGNISGFTFYNSTLSDKLADWRTSYDNMVRCSGNERDLLKSGDITNAQVYSVPPASSAYCGITPDVTNIKVGEVSSNNIFIHSGELLQLKFNTSVNEEQLPLQTIAIDWDGGGTSDQIVNWGFAPLTNVDNPHSISHVYRYGVGIDSEKCYQAGAGPYGTHPSVGGHEYCVVQPQVQVRDNWDWCNFTGTATATTYGRCRNFPVDGNSDYWRQFSKDIIVIRS